MSYMRHWYEFFYRNNSHRWSIGYQKPIFMSSVFHINAYLFGFGIVSRPDRKLWVGFWPRIPIEEGESLYKYSHNFRF